LAPLAHAAKELDDDQAAWLASLPYTTTLPGASAAHASLYQPQAFPFISDAASALPTLELLRERVDVFRLGRPDCRRLGRVSRCRRELRL
jgi:hypothetical protein